MTFDLFIFLGGGGGGSDRGGGGSGGPSRDGDWTCPNG